MAVAGTPGRQEDDHRADDVVRSRTQPGSLPRVPRGLRLLLTWLLGIFVLAPLVVVVIGPALVNLTK